ncbi:alpha/beta fold hydrolase [Psychromarinibacter halotolerans]|uniref:Alpha/beta fold hydrolase n=1 Tax=Psychromarinibacter halotolerans TaxID=1775175 RepID=A0ABV7GSL9_9RHOB|nr:alpha/beta fold hydrolase [Psychromarinibacter halotolerans]MDF0596761.1 alpha/beta fold hydrolase [Psychromarinibacter halotolerans]
MKITFGDCAVDTGRHMFWKAGKSVRLEPQVFDVLAYFLRNPGKVISRDDLVEAVWDGRAISDSTISTRINAVRRAIGDNDRANRMLETLSKRGYRLSAQVSGDTRTIPNIVNLERQIVKVARSADGTIIAHATSSEGPPLMRAGQFLTHLNMDWESEVRRPTLDRLGAHFALTRYDQRGTGLSGGPMTDFSLERLVEDMLAVADDAELDKFSIWATSQGVPVSLAFAAAHPKRVNRMVLYGGFVQGRAVRQQEANTVQADTLLDLISEGWGKPGGAFGKAYATLFMPDATAAQMDDMCKMQLASASPETAIALRRSIDSFDVSDILEQVRVPVLVVHTTEDSVNPLSQSRLMASLLPEAQLKIVDGRNHVPLPGTDAWETIMRVSVNFLRSA